VNGLERVSDQSNGEVGSFRGCRATGWGGKFALQFMPISTVARPVALIGTGVGTLVVRMTRSAMTAQLGPEFDAFLFAPVGEERSGVLLSVISALARQDIDPWREAAALARMPRAAANQRLASLIAALPDTPALRLAAAGIADRLVKLLPSRESFAAATGDEELGGDPAPTVRAVGSVIIINILVMVGLLCAQWALASMQPQPRVDTSHAPVASSAMPELPRASQGD